MEYLDLIRRKNQIFIITMFICIAIRSIVNAFFVPPATMIGMVVAGFVLTAILYFLSKKIPPVLMMYMMVLLMTGLTVMLNVAFPCTTNFLMFFLAIFLVVLYEDFKPILLQCVLSAVFMMYFYFHTGSERLSESWGTDALAMCISYVASAAIIYWSLCRLTKMQLDYIRDKGHESERQRKKAEKLVGHISDSVSILDNTSKKIDESISMSNQISSQIAEATEDVTRSAADEVTEVDEIRSMVQNSVDQIRAVTETSMEMAKESSHTSEKVADGGRQVAALTQQMEDLKVRMDGVGTSVGELGDATNQIVEILQTLDEITSQTNLLSLNASIEAARAGEHGKGFAVVASEIRNLSDDSAKFTTEIHNILEGINDQTEKVRREIAAGQQSVDECTAEAEEVDNAFKEISDDTTSLASQAQDIENKSQALEDLLNRTLADANDISGNVEATSAAMEEISASIQNLNGSLDIVVDGYNDINGITQTLMEQTSDDSGSDAENTPADAPEQERQIEANE